jgi:hypothetical protein
LRAFTAPSHLRRDVRPPPLFRRRLLCGPLAAFAALAALGDLLRPFTAFRALGRPLPALRLARSPPPSFGSPLWVLCGHCGFSQPLAPPRGPLSFAALVRPLFRPFAALCRPLRSFVPLCRPLRSFAAPSRPLRSPAVLRGRLRLLFGSFVALTAFCGRLSAAPLRLLFGSFVAPHGPFAALFAATLRPFAATAAIGGPLRRGLLQPYRSPLPPLVALRGTLAALAALNCPPRPLCGSSVALTAPWRPSAVFRGPFADPLRPSAAPLRPFAKLCYALCGPSRPLSVSWTNCFDAPLFCPRPPLTFPRCQGCTLRPFTNCFIVYSLFLTR